MKVVMKKEFFLEFNLCYLFFGVFFLYGFVIMILVLFDWIRDCLWEEISLCRL